MAWQPPPEDLHNGIIQSYLINCTEIDTGMTFNVSTILTEIIISSLHPAYFYICQVSAVTVDVGVFSENVTVQTLEAGMYLSIHCNALVTFLYFYFLFSTQWSSSQSDVNSNLIPVSFTLLGFATS